MTPVKIRAVNSLIWIVSGMIVIIVRTLLIQTASILLWEVLGGGMILYGTVRLVLGFVRAAPPDSSIP